MIYHSIQANHFQVALSDWFGGVKRELPWRANKNPYSIWISEVILQQTRVDQGLPYFNRFISRFPTVQDLGNSSIDDVLKTWEGLGYYSRARNLHAGAQFVLQQWNGVLPSSYEELLLIPGVGPYTAAAIASIAFGKPCAVVDGNVIRVLTRLFSYAGEPSKAESKRWLKAKADQLIDEDNPGRHNEAMMELGALVCSPAAPLCKTCPVATFCSSFGNNNPLDFPVKKVKRSIPHHQIAVGILRNQEGHIYIQRRSEDGMLGGLWEFPGGKNEPPESLETTCVREIKEETGFDVEVVSKLASIPHAYSHFKITLHAYLCTRRESTEPQTDLSWKWAAREQLVEYAFPKANRKLIEVIVSQSVDDHDVASS